MTEEEAKTKICPVFSIKPEVIYQIDKSREFPAQQQTVYRRECIGSACMMWRKGEPSRFFNGAPVFAPFDHIPFEAIQLIEHGYCGLAGKP